LLERAPGREAYPGDIFYIHSQLMERAGYLRPELGGGSMTFFPIVDILQGDVTGYISTNMKKFTYREKRSCICGEPFYQNNRIIEKHMNWGTVRFVQCQNCKTWVQSPQIDKESLKLWYDSIEYQAAGVSKAKEGIYLDYMADESQRKMEAQARYKRDLVSILSPGSRILEVGCATGSLLAVMRKEGHHVVGIDLSAKFVQQAKLLYGLDVILGDFYGIQYLGEGSRFII